MKQQMPSRQAVRHGRGAAGDGADACGRAREAARGVDRVGRAALRPRSRLATSVPAAEKPQLVLCGFAYLRTAMLGREVVE